MRKEEPPKSSYPIISMHNMPSGRAGEGQRVEATGELKLDEKTREVRMRCIAEAISEKRLEKRCSILRIYS